jgi:hypothetical protein
MTSAGILTNDPSLGHPGGTDVLDKIKQPQQHQSERGTRGRAVEGYRIASGGCPPFYSHCLLPALNISTLRILLGLILVLAFIIGWQGRR